MEWDHTISDVRKRFPDVRRISTEELARWISNREGAPFVLLDTRESEEFAVSHIRGARLLVPGSDPGQGLEDVEKSRFIVAYCSVGYRSAETAREFQKMGYTNVYNLEGSIFKWANEGRELVRDDEPVRSVHPYDKTWGRLLDPAYRSTQE